ncbi:MAG: FeoA family protein [Candidatus Nanoarchaeia archaeon]|nr:FeoA family protein [Candidatus Nanoarchaeia archaeon]
MEEKKLKLSELVEGESGIIICFDKNPPRMYGCMQRLMEWGFLKGAEVKIEAIAFGTYRVKVKGQQTTYGIGKGPLEKIYVKKTNE